MKTGFRADFEKPMPERIGDEDVQPFSSATGKTLREPALYARWLVLILSF